MDFKNNSNHNNFPQDENPIEELVKKIESYYNELKQRKNLHKIIREVSEEKILDKKIAEDFEEELEALNDKLDNDLISEESFNEELEELREKAKNQIDTTYLYDDVILKYKKRTSWSWKEEFNEVLLDLGRLHECKTILKSDEKHFDIADFRLPDEKYIKIYEQLQATKEQKKIQKELEKEKDFENKKQLQLKDMDELISIFKENKIELNKLNKMYDKDRDKLLKAMIKQDIEEISSDKGISFKTHDRATGYDNISIMNSTINKKILFTVKVLNEKEIECKDWFTKETFILKNSIEHDGHKVHLKDGKLFVDETPLYTPKKEEVDFLKKKDIKEIEKDQYALFYGTVPIDGLDFLMSRKTSSSKVEELIDKNALEPNVMKEYRYINSENDMNVFFEMIDEESDNQRKTVFFDKLSQRGQRKREQNEMLKNLYEGS